MNAREGLIKNKLSTYIINRGFVTEESIFLSFDHSTGVD